MIFNWFQIGCNLHSMSSILEENMRKIIILSIVSVFFFFACSSNEEETADIYNISDIATEDILDVFTDTLSDASTDISEVIKCKSSVVGIYGPSIKYELSFSAEIYPFPNDFYTTIDSNTPTGIRLNYPQDVLLNGINELNGFPTFPFLLARFIDPSDTEGKYKITPIVADKYNKRNLLEDFVFLLPLDVLLSSNDRSEIEKALLPLEIHSNNMGGLYAEVREILEENREYIFFVTNDLKVRIEDVDGKVISDEECISTPPNFEALKLKRPIDARFPELEPYRQSLVNVFDALENKLSIVRDRIIMLSRFKTSQNFSIMKDIKDQIDNIQDFNVEIKDIFKPLDENKKLTEKMKEYLPCAEDIKSIEEFYDYDFSNVDSIVIGYYDSPNYLIDKNRLNYDINQRRFLPVGKNRVEFILILPIRDEPKGIKSPAPFVLFQHAFEVCKETSMALAGTFTSFGFAIGGIDMIGHGIRSGKPRCEDGRLYCDTQSLDFIKVNDMLTTVNWLRQSAIDTMAFYKMVKGLKIDIVPSKSDENGVVIKAQSGDGIQDIDIVNTLFTSQSLGSYLGISIVSLLNDFNSAVFNVPAAAFFKLLSIDLSENGEIWELGDMYLPFILSIQTLVDEIEVLNFTKRYFIDGGVNMNVLIQAAKNDKVVPHNGTEMLGHFMRLEQVDALRVIEDVPQVNTPHSGSYHSDKLTAAYYQFDPAEHIFYLKSFTEGVRESAQYQSAVFLKSSLFRKDKGGLVINPYSCSQISDFISEAKSYPLEIFSNPFCK